MKVLLDTHLLLWVLSDDKRLSKNARFFLDNEDIDFYYSVISLWEIQMKHISDSKNLPFTAEEIEDYCNRSGFKPLPLLPQHIHAIDKLYRSAVFSEHKDPFDKLLISQAEVENMIFLTHDDTLAYYTDNFIIVV